MNIKIIVCQIIGPAAAGSTGPVPTPVSMCNNNLAGSGRHLFYDDGENSIQFYQKAEGPNTASLRRSKIHYDILHTKKNIFRHKNKDNAITYLLCTHYRM